MTSVGIKLTLDGAAQAEAGLRRVQGGMAALGSTAESVRGALQQLAGAFAGVVSVRAFVQAADAVTQLQNQLRLATGSTQAATQAYQQLFEIAQRSRVSFTELGGTFASIARASESLGLSQQQLLRLTETIGNAITVSGSSAQASQAALVQLSQGLASGVLRGEELNSILEQTPRLARALADGLGVSVGALRKLGEEGKLTADAVIGALQSQAAVLAKEVQNSTVTVGQAFTQLQNESVKAVGELDNATGASKALAAGLQTVAQAVKGLGALASENTVAVQAIVGAVAGASVIAALGQAAGAVRGLAAAWGLLTAAMAANPIGAVAVGLAAVGGAAVFALKEWQKTESGIKDSIKGLEQQISASQAALERARARGADASVRQIEARIAEKRAKIAELRAELAAMDKSIDTRAEDARLARYQADAVKRMEDAKRKAAEQQAAQLKSAKAAADDYAKSVERGAKAYADLIAQQSGLNANFAEQWKDLSDAYKAGAINLEQLTQAQAALLAQQPAMKQAEDERKKALEDQAKALEAASRAEAERIKALERSAESAEEQLQRLLDEEKALTIAAEKNITLAQALEEVAIARLREQQAALKREGGRDAEVQAIQREIDARKKLAEAIGRKEAREAAAESAREAEREWRRTAEGIERSLTDALLRGFESGKDFARNLRDTIVNMFNTMVLRPVIQAIVAPVAGGLTGLFGLPSTANAATGGSGAFGLASGLKSVYDTIVGGFTSLGNSVAFAAQDIGAWLVNNTTGVLNKFGGSLLSNAGTLGTAASYLGGIGAGIGLGRLISGGYSAIGKSGNTATIAGTAIGAFFGPIGAAIGGAAGGLINRAFGRGPKETQAAGIVGTFSTEGASVQNFQEWRRKGGWFRSDKRGTDYSPISGEFDQFLDDSLRAITSATKAYAEVLGLNANAVNGITQSIRIHLKGLNPEQQEQEIAKALSGFGDLLARRLLGTFTEFVRQGETAGQALSRLAGSLATVNNVFDTLNTTLLQTSLRGGDAASKLLDAFGGAEPFRALANTYFSAFYDEAERISIATRQLNEAFARLGLAVPRTRAEFRALVESQNLYTDAGRNTYAELLKLAGAFDAVQTGAQNVSNTLRELASQVTSAFEPLRGRISGTRGDVASAISDITGRAILSPDQIRASIRAAMVSAPSTAGLASSAAQVAAAEARLAQMNSASAQATARANQERARLDELQAELGAKQRQLTMAPLAALQNQLIRVSRGQLGWRRRTIERPGYQQELAAFNARSAELQAQISSLSAAVSQQQAIYNDAAAAAQFYTQQLEAAKVALKASQDAQVAAQEQYARGVRQFIVDAGKSVEKLNDLRQSVIAYYESQRELAEAMLGSAARLREAAGAVRFGQLSAQEASDQLLAQFQQNYSMALATTGVTRAQYADRLSEALPQLSESLRSSSMTREEWIVATARLVGQANTVASLLEQSAPKDYEAESLALLGDIDQALASIEASAASAEKTISDAIYETGAQNLTGLRAIVATLRGESVPRFALGGQHAGGIRLVGENGPELEVTGPARYWSYEQTRRLMGGASSDEATANELRALREEQRAQAGAMVALQQRFIKLLERWDVQGLPEERVVA